MTKLSPFQGVIAEIQFGSHLYKLNSETSDHDYAGIYIPTLDDILMGKTTPVVDLSDNKKTKNGIDDVDRKFYSLRKFIELAAKGDTNVMDILHCSDDDVLITSNLFNLLRSVKSKCYTKNCSSMVGYLKAQANKYGVKGSRLAAVNKALKMCNAIRDKSQTLEEYWDFIPTSEFSKLIITDTENSGIQRFYEVCGRKYQDCLTFEEFEENMKALKSKYGHRAEKAESNDGVDFKAISHALRVGYQTQDILTKGTYSFPLDQTDFIKKVKSGNVNIGEVRQVLEDLVKSIEIQIEESDLPEEPDVKFWDDLYLKICRDWYDISIDEEYRGG